MLYQLKEKIWTFNDSYKIKDKDGLDAFQIEGKVFSWGDNLSFRNNSGEEVFKIKQILLSFMPKYVITKNGEELAEIRKKFSWLNQKFELDVPGPNDYVITGSFWQREFEFMRGNKVAARVSKKFWNWSDTYGIDVMEGENDELILATAVVIDLVLFDKKNNSNNS